MREVYWNNTERWNNHHHYELLIEDITGFDLKKSLCEESVKYMAKDYLIQNIKGGLRHCIPFMKMNTMHWWKNSIIKQRVMERLR